MRGAKFVEYECDLGKILVISSSSGLSDGVEPEELLDRALEDIAKYLGYRNGTRYMSALSYRPKLVRRRLAARVKKYDEERRAKNEASASRRR